MRLIIKRSPAKRITEICTRHQVSISMSRSELAAFSITAIDLGKKGTTTLDRDNVIFIGFLDLYNVLFIVHKNLK